MRRCIVRSECFKCKPLDQIAYESFKSSSVVVACRRCGRNTRIRSRGDAAFLDGDVARVAGPWRYAERARPHVYDPASLLHLRRAWNLFVGACVERRAVSTANNIERHLVLSRGTGVLPDRLHFGHALVVGGYRSAFMHVFWCRFVVA